MPKYLVTITDNMGDLYDEFVITNPDALIDSIGLFGVLPGGELD